MRVSAPSLQSSPNGRMRVSGIAPKTVQSIARQTLAKIRDTSKIALMSENVQIVNDPDYI